MGSEVMSNKGRKNSKYKVTMQDIRAAAKRLKNWGRWGKDDEIGTLNYITPEDEEVLARRGLLDSYIHCDVTAEPDRLEEVRTILEDRFEIGDAG